MKFAASLLALFLAASSCLAGYLRLPAEVRGEVGDFVTVSADTDLAVVKFIPLDRGLAVFPSHLLKDQKSAVLVAKQPGRYRILAYSAENNTPTEPVFCVVIIGQPGPDPTPPGPTPPGPSDPLLQSLQAAYNQESDAAGKKRDCESLSNIYKTFHKHLQDGGTFTNWGEFFDAMSNSAKNLQVNGKVMKVQEVLQKELFQKKFPSRRSETFDSAVAKPVLLQASTLLEQLTK